MEITLLYLITVGGFAAVLLVNYRAALFLAVFLYSIYPRFFSLGVSDDGFALTAQRAMLLMLAGMYVLRALWGSWEVRYGWQILSRYRGIMIALLVYLTARLAGNVLSGTVGVGMIVQLVSETLISGLVLVLVVTYVRSRSDILALLTLILVSLLFNQLISIYEFSTQSTIFPESIALQYDTGSKGEELLEGRVRDEAYRAMGIFDNPLKLSAFLGMMLPLSVFLMGCARTTLMRVLAGTSVVLALPTAFFAGSRAALGIVLLVFCWYAYQWLAEGMSRAGRRFLAFCGVVVGGGLLLGVGSGLIQEFLFGDAYARSTEARFIAYATVPLLLLDSPIFGFGYSRNIVEALNLGALDPFYLRLALEGGVVSLIAFLVILSGAFRVLRPAALQNESAFDRDLARSLRLAFAVIGLLAIVLTISYVRMYFFLFVGLAMVLMHLWRHDLSSSDAGRAP